MGKWGKHMSTQAYITTAMFQCAETVHSMQYYATKEINIELQKDSITPIYLLHILYNVTKHLQISHYVANMMLFFRHQ